MTFIFEKPCATGHSGFGIPTRSPTEISGKMARSKCLLLGLLLFSCLHLPALGQDDEIEDIEVVEEEKAFLIVRKNVVDREKVVVGKAITVEIEIHNAGTRYTTWPRPSDQGEHCSILYREAQSMPKSSHPVFFGSLKTPLVTNLKALIPFHILHSKFWQKRPDGM